MYRALLVIRVVVLLAACSAALTLRVARGDAKDKPPIKNSGAVSGLLVDFKDDGVIVAVDGEEEPTKFKYAGMTRQDLVKRQIFPVDRVNLKIKIEGDEKKLTAIEKVPGRATGTVVGKVLKVYNDFWVAVKPTNGGMVEGFALNFPPEKFKQSHDLIKTLKPGDLVAIRYATDFERHRILQMEVKREAKGEK